ncbi:protein MCM10 homolog isoform X2 [Ostrea edulis]|uniref:protein MCM10 homolog isoform X2 n=1 Tax=Ostrea edulis TaxID=37623 RepID=UPI0024AF9579|nr:protein MCM10 homolog isoform X2 [Ostrea edulis]
MYLSFYIMILLYIKYSYVLEMGHHVLEGKYFVTLTGVYQNNCEGFISTASMSDDECELDVLVSLLDDNSDTECVGQHELTDKKSQTTDTAQETTKLLKATANTESTDCTNEATANTESSDWTNKEKECDVDMLTACLEEDDSEFEGGDLFIDSAEQSGDEKSVSIAENNPSKEGSNSSHTSEDEDSAIQAELLNIQKKMLELQSQLKRRKINKKKISSESSSSLVANGTKENREDDISFRLQQKDQSSCERQKQPPLISKQKTDRHKQKTDRHNQKTDRHNQKISDQQTTATSLPSKKGIKKSFSRKNGEQFKSEKKPCKIVSPNSEVKVPKDKKELPDADECGGNLFFPDQTDPEGPGEGTGGLFGDNDSDWEELDGEAKPELSKSGQVIQDLMKKGNRQRVSCTSQGAVQELRQRALKTNSWKTGPFSGQEMVDPRHKAAIEDHKSVTDPFSGIRIINPKISSMEMKYKMADRLLIKLSKIHLKLKSADLQGNWVTIGVIVHKTEPRTSSSGKSFCIWRLSDLDDCEKTISFFLFGEVFKQHWKNEVKSVVGILNPNKMDKAEKNQQDMAFTVHHPNQILMMGYSQDLGKCAGVSKAGKACTNFINKQLGQFCVYHVQSAYKKTCAKRTELQGSSQVTPKNRVFGTRNVKESMFFYGGETFTNTRRKSSKKDQVTVKNLQMRQLESQGKFTTMSLHNLNLEDREKLQQVQQKKKDLVNLLATPTVGSLNFVKHLVKKENPSHSDSSDDKKVEIQSISPAELLKQHKLDMVRKRKARHTTTVTAPGNLDSQTPRDIVPHLGRGEVRDGFISLDMSNKTNSVSMKELAKIKAITKVKNSGGIQKDDPNALKRKRESPDFKEKIETRVLSSIGNERTESKKGEPAVKRSKLLGNIDENSEEFRMLMKSRSKHTGALAEVEHEQEERYFMELEKKEKYEDKMQSTMSVKCSVFTCKNCNYTAMKLADKCKRDGHTIVKLEGSKRFFKCKHCGKRKISIHKYPTEPCDCGEYNFQRTAMMEERKGPKLPNENLSLRGDEVSYLGAMNQKVYLDI